MTRSLMFPAGVPRLRPVATCALPPTRAAARDAAGTAGEDAGAPHYFGAAAGAATFRSTSRLIDTFTSSLSMNPPSSRARFQVMP